MILYTKEIPNFDEYVKTIQSFKSIRPKDKQGKIDRRYVPVFRGVHEKKNSDKYLMPKLAWKNLVKYEYDIIVQMQTIRPIEFNQGSELDIIGKCQHYGLPTRLLDFTQSEIVSLFFAVESAYSKVEEDEISKVYCMFANFDSSIVAKKILQTSSRMRAYMYDERGDVAHNFVEDIICSIGASHKSRQNETHEFIKKILRSPIFIYPKFYTLREQNQQSVFMVLANKIYDKKSECVVAADNFNEQKKKCNLKNYRFLPELYNIYPVKNDFPSEEWVSSEKKSFEEEAFFLELIIEESARQEMREKLHALGINKAFIFPDNLDLIAEGITKAFEENDADKN